jgi:hypothetical protein
MRASAVAISFLLAFSPIHSQGAFLDGNDLLRECTTPRQAICLGYVMGVADVLARHDIFDWEGCMGSHVASSQIKDAVLAYLRTHIADRQFEASGLVAHAISEAFRCPLPR